MTPNELSREMARDAESIARYLLPEGKRDGKEWRVGSTNGEQGKSLGVRINGDRAGVWSDFASGEAGDVLDLWCAVRGCDLVTAMKEAKDFLGIKDERPNFMGHKAKQYKPPVVPKCNKPKGEVFTYLTEVRKLTQATLDAFKIAEMGHKIIFPYIRDGVRVMIKTDTTRRDKNGKRLEPPKPTSADQEPCLFGWQALNPNARYVILTEGEIDCMTWHQFGHPALSVPFGGGKGAKQAWIETEWERLERFDEIYICMDNDEVGREAMREIIDRLGRHRCRIIEGLIHKDINESLQHGLNALLANQLVEKARYIAPEELKSASEYADDVVDAFYPKGDEPGFTGPWEHTHKKFRFREAELTILNGINGHGKSQVAGHLTLGAMIQGQRACIASMELSPRRLLHRLTRQAAGLSMAKPTEEYIRTIVEWYQDKLWIFELVGTAKTQRLLEVFEYARKRYGVKLFVIDSLMKCGIGEDDYNAQKKFVEDLCDFKNAHDCHIFLVTHSRKGESEEKPSGKMDVKGTGAITDLADNVFVAWRNKPKERDMEKLKDPVLNKIEDIDQFEKEVTTRPDAMLDCCKQRNGEWEGKVALWFDRGSQQYLSSHDERPHQYVEFFGQKENTW